MEDFEICKTFPAKAPRNNSGLRLSVSFGFDLCEDIADFELYRSFHKYFLTFFISFKLNLCKEIKDLEIYNRFSFFRNNSGLPISFGFDLCEDIADFEL